MTELKMEFKTGVEACQLIAKELLINSRRDFYTKLFKAMKRMVLSE